MSGGTNFKEVCVCFNLNKSKSKSYFVVKKYLWTLSCNPYLFLFSENSSEYFTSVFQRWKNKK